MTLVNRDTRELLTELYVIAGVQVKLGKEDATLSIKWDELRARLARALIKEGIEIPS